MAVGEPPYAELHPMKVSPRSIPTEGLGSLSHSEERPASARRQVLEDISRFCRTLSTTRSTRCESLCFKSADLERPSAKELLKHRFIKTARKVSYLTELVERHEKWKAEGGAKAEDGGKSDIRDEE